MLHVKCRHRLLCLGQVLHHGISGAINMLGLSVYLGAFGIFRAISTSWGGGMSRVANRMPSYTMTFPVRSPLMPTGVLG